VEIEEIVMFSQLDNLLLGLDAAEYIPLFNRHGVNLEMFLQLNEKDLVQCYKTFFRRHY
jgi:hypothetical protein